MYSNTDMYAPPPPPPPPAGAAPPVSLDDLFGPPAGSDCAPPPPPPPYDGPSNNTSAAPSAYSQQQQYPYHQQQQQPAPYHHAAAQPPPPPPPQPQPAPIHGQGMPGSYYQGPAAPTAAYAPVPVTAQHQPQPQPQPQSQPAARSQEDEDREQLEKIVRLRRELEMEQEREQQKRLEGQTWGCTECTYRNQLGDYECAMCGTSRAGFAGKAKTSAGAAPTAAPPTAASRPAGPTAWQCGLCLAPNEASNDRCKACSAFRSGGVPIPSSHNNTTRNNNNNNNNNSGIQSKTPFTTDWRCSMCATVNKPSQPNCAACNSFQSHGTPVQAAAQPVQRVPSASPEASATVWSCSVCTLENGISNAVCSACGSGQRPRHLAPPKSKKGAAASGSGGGAAVVSEWPCPTCTFVNPVSRSRCDMCAAERPAQYAPAPSAKDTANKKREAESDDDEVQWQADHAAQECNRCHQGFGMMRRRHHCRACGYVFCATCSPFQLQLKKNGELERVCANCYEAKKKEKKK